ncbi:MAG: 50S ribosomal protein L6 [Phycisphaeraceae bacterium]|nr:50S ribosomal protein L6 [Phycisphaeraceae bacterium]MCB9847292.1 50S ribosomal protein L6 [Phycisphaeraceae bacterium]
MSRIGNKPISVPGGVNCTISGREVTIAKGDKSLSMTHRPEISVVWDEGERSISCAPAPGFEDSRQARAYWGMTRALLQNMVTGVTEGYKKSLEVVGVGWGASMKGAEIEMKVGYANPIGMPIPSGLDVKVDKQFIHIEGPDKQKVGQFAAMLRSTRKPEPYTGRGVKYTNEVVRRKQGKVFGS